MKAAMYIVFYEIVRGELLFTSLYCTIIHKKILFSLIGGFKMRKTLTIFMTMLMAIMLVACNNDTNVSNEDSNGNEIGTVTIQLTRDNGEEEISEDEVALYEGDTVMDVMKRNYDIETAYEGEFIHGINGIAPEEGENYAWMYTVNGEEAMVGATEYELEPGDVVHFDYASWE